MKRKQGISLIVLVITIIVMVVLAAAVVITLSNTGIINKANEAVSDTDLKSVEQLASLAWAEEFMDGKRGDTLKNDVSEKLKDYTDKYNFNIDDTGVEVTKKDDGATQLTKDYFVYEYDNVNMTATIVGVKEEYSESSYYDDGYTEHSFSSAIIEEDGRVITDVVIPSTTVGTDGETYTVTAINSGVFAPDAWNAYEGMSYAYAQLPRYTSIELPDTITTIAENAFIACVNLENIKLSSKLTAISGSAFCACKKLNNVVIPSSVISIENNAFSYCEALTSIIIPEKVTTIGSSAFAYCDSLTTITLPKTLTSVGYRAFFLSQSITDVYYTGAESEWNAIDINEYGNETLKNATLHYN